jgi:hypothetical protein
MPSRSKRLLLSCMLFCFLSCITAVQTCAETFRNPRRIPLSVDPYGVTTGDLNGDGLKDIVWTERPAYPGPAVLHVLLATAGGQYTAAPNVSVPFYPTFMQCAIEDVTGDKRNDLVCVGASSDYVNVFLLAYLGNGDGTFAAPIETKLSTQVTFSNPILGFAGDLNGDGLPDIIVMNAYYSGVLSYLSDGKGGFKLGGTLQGSFNYSVPTVTDLNGDGKLDILWPTGPRVDLGNGDGTFSAITQYDPGYDSNCAFGDVDHDGHLDAACTWFDNGDLDGVVHLGIFHGNNDGSFSKTPLFTRTFGNGQNSYDGLPTIVTPVLVADINGDGYADIISLSGDGYCVLLGGSNTSWSGQPRQFVTATQQSEGGIYGIYGVSIADMNGDGLPDIVAIGPNGLYITYAQPDGTLSSAPATEVGQVSTSVTLVDVNGDGNLDVVSAGDTALELSLGRGDGTFSSPQPITTIQNFNDTNYVRPRVISGDFNGDGKQDLIAAGSVAAYTTQNYMMFGNGDGTFAVPQPIGNSVSLGKVVDLNADGRSDIISIQASGGSNNSLIANISRGDGTFTTASTNLPVESATNGSVYASEGLAIADFRHSGKLDAAVASYNNVYLLRGHVDGTFDSTSAPLPIPDIPNLNKTEASDVSTGDFDGDGNPDIAVLIQYGNGAYNLSTPTSAVWIFYGNGDGTFSNAVLAGTFNRDAQTLSSGDLNGDGLDDLVLTSYDVYQYTGVLIVHALPKRTWGPEVDYTGGEGLSPLWITDINHDGRNDLIFSNASRSNEASNSVAVLLNQHANIVDGTLTALPEPSNVTYPFTLRAALFPSNSPNILNGIVTFSFDGTVVGTASLVSNTASLNLSGINVAAGTHTLSASWTGDVNYPAVTLSGIHVVVLLPLTISLMATPTSVSVGSAVTATAMFTPTLNPNISSYQFTGIMTLFDNGVAIGQQHVSPNNYSFNLSSLTVGTHILSVSYPGDLLFSAAQSNPVTVTVVGAASTATLTANHSTSTYGTPVTFTATIAPAMLPDQPIPSGTVTFLIDGKPLAPVALTNAVASTTVSALAAAGHTVSCTYSGDTTYAAATCNTVLVTVTAGSSALTITSSQNPSIAYTPVTFTMYLTLNGQPAPAGTQLTFSIMGNSNNVLLSTDATGTATYTASQLPAGTWDTVAIFSGSNYTSSTNHYSQVVTPAPTVLSLTTKPNPATTGQMVSFVANGMPKGAAFPSGTVTFFEGSNVLGFAILNSTGQATFSTSTLAVGTHAVIATYPGDSSFLSSTSNTVTEVVNASDILLSTDHSSLTIETEHYKSLNVNLASVGGLTGTFALACGPLPDWASCHFGSATLGLPSNGNATTTLEIDTDAVYHFKSKLEIRPIPTQPFSKLPFLALTPMWLLIFSLRRKRPYFSRNTFLCLICATTLLASTSSLIGCGDKYPAHTQPGTYAVQVTATSTPGSAVAVTRTTTFTLIVTP